MFRFYLDNTLVPDALNWFDFTETIERDEVIKAILPKYDVKLTFNGAGYAYLFEQRKTYGYCKLIELRIEQQCSPNSGYEIALNGLIFISDCKFNESKCTVECSVMDNNYGAKIFNNKSIGAFLNVGRSKNDVAITPCAYDDIRMFEPTSGAFDTETRRVYKVHDAFRFLIDFMTDGVVGFESDFLSTFTDESGVEALRLTTGQEIRLHDRTKIPFISFADLFHEVDIKYPLGFTIINVAGIPTIKIEEDAYFKNKTPSITVQNIDDFVSSFNSELLYSKVKFGSTYLDYDGMIGHYPQVRFFNFADEEYHLKGECNIDKTLDLTGFIISDTNVIESCFSTENDNDTYDDELFFVQVNSQTSDASMMYDLITYNIPYFYNPGLINSKIAERYSLQNNIAIYLGNNDDTFRSESTITQDVSSDYSGLINNTTNVYCGVIAFQNDSTGGNYDTNGNYNNTTYRFVSPASGNYNFDANIVMKIQAGVELPGQDLAAITRLQVVYRVYGSGGAFLRDEFCPEYNYVPAFTNGGEFNVFGSKNIYIPSGGYVNCVVSVISTGVVTSYQSTNILATSYFLCDQSVNGGGVYGKEFPADYFISMFEFDAPLSKSQYDLMKADLSKAVVINHDGKTNRTTWIRKTVRKMATGEMKWEQISSKNNSQ